MENIFIYMFIYKEMEEMKKKEFKISVSFITLSHTIYWGYQRQRKTNLKLCNRFFKLIKTF